MNADKQRRYRLETFHVLALEGNLPGSPAERSIQIYLPPGYFDDEKTRYPVVYLLHGYGADSGNPMVNSLAGLRAIYPLRLRVPFYRIFSSLLTFEKLDRLILSKEITPFILVQPDGSLHLPNIFGVKGMNGRISRKGSLYTDSPFSGSYAPYIFEEVVYFIDAR